MHVRVKIGFGAILVLNIINVAWMQMQTDSWTEHCGDAMHKEDKFDQMLHRLQKFDCIPNDNCADQI